MSLAIPPNLANSKDETFARPSVGGGQIVEEESILSVLNRILKKRFKLIVGAIVFGLACGIVANIVIPTKYRAQASIEIVPDTSNQFRLEQGASLQFSQVDTTKIDTEIAKISSNSLALETIQGLRLDQNPDFVRITKGQFLDLADPNVRHMLITTFQKDLVGDRLGRTNIVQLRFTTRNASLSARIVNTLIDNYVEGGFKDNYQATEQVSQWLDAQLTELKKEVQQREEQMLAVQKEIGLVGIDATQSVLLKYLEEINRAYADAQADRLTKEARIVALRSASPEVIQASSLNDMVLGALAQKQSELSTEYASLIQRYGPNYPRVKEIKSQLDQTQTSLAIRQNALLGRAEEDYKAALQTENALKQSLEGSEKDAFSQNSKAAQYLLAREGYESSRILYDGLEQRLKEAGIIAGLHSTSIHVVDRADAPVFASQPLTLLNLAGGVFGGAFLGVVLALVIESLDTTLRSISEIEDVLQLPLLAALPETERIELKPSTFVKHASGSEPGTWSRMAEAVRNLRTAILLSSPGTPPKVLLITSTRPAEGKSSLACVGAISLSLNGSRVLLIDADLRRPTIHTRFGMTNKVGLSSVLSGKVTSDEAIQVWEEYPSVHIFTAGPQAPMPAELLGSRQMHSLIEKLRDSYDFIILDTPPVLTVTDAAILTRLADGTILVIRYGDVQRNVVLRSTEVLARAGAHMLGVIVNVVNFNAPEYSEYYGKKYYDYYDTRPTETNE
jgi:capsular exopolysaccharide synthesis family protein